MSRIPLLAPDDLDEDQRQVYDAITTGPRGASGRSTLLDARGALVGPFNAMVAAPAVGARLQALGSAIRYGTSLTPRARELAVLQVAAHHRSDFEWETHTREGRAVGLADAEIAAVGRGDPAAVTDPGERVVLSTARAMLDTFDLTEEQYGAAVDALGVVGLLELITLVGYYSLLALQLRVLRVPASAPGPWAGGG